MRRRLLVLTSNLRQLRDDRDALIEVLRASGADVVAVQEPPRGPFGGRRLRSVAESAGYRPVVSGGGARTTALLVRDGLEATGARAARLPWRPGRTRRGLAVADVAGVRVVSVHLGLLPGERLAHVDRLLRLVAAAPGECVVAGDLNEEPGGPSRRRLAQALRDLTAGTGPTFPARRPRRRIDAVLVTIGLSGAAQVVFEGPVDRASDHLPLLAEVRW